MKTQKTLTSQSNLEGKKNGGINPPEFRLYHKAIVFNSMVLAQKQKYRSNKQEKKLRDKPSNLIWCLIFDKGDKNT